MLALWIVSAVVIIAVWVAVFVLSLPWWIALIVTLVFVLAILGTLLFRFLRAKARAAALERELLRQAAEQANKARPDRRAEILALQAQMKDAIASLKHTKLGARGGTSALYALPWYVIVGPPAAGKTTALEKSGLAFTSTGGKGPRVKGTAGTRNCDWWFSQDAILLDTAGRFSTEDDDQDEWFAFLDTVKRFRPKRPLDGVIVALSLTDLMNADEAQIEELATKLRARVDELMTRFEMVVPIYVMFTKADLVAGFIEFWGDMSKSQRTKAWGATFAREDDRLTEPARAFEEEFDELLKVLHSRMLARLRGERLPAVRGRILQFPLELQSLRTSLARFIEELCRTNPYQETPLLRGFYFTSGTQVGRPLDRVLANMVQGFKLRPNEVGPAAEPQSYFVTELFKSIIFPDRHLAVRSSSRIRRATLRQIVLGSLAAFLTLTTVLFAVLNYVDNVDLVHATQRDVLHSKEADRTSGTNAIVGAAALGALLDRVVQLEQAQAHFRIPALWGLGAATTLYAPVQDLYLSRLRTVVDGPVRDELTSDVRAIGDLVRVDAENYEMAYQDLRLYVMLVTSPDHLEAEWAAKSLAEAWGRAERSDANANTDQLALHARYYIDALAKNPGWRWAPDETTLARARAKLSSLPLEEIQYGWLINQAKGVAPFKPEKVLYGPAAQYFTTRGGVVVPGAYTKPGWEKIRAALERFDARLVVEPWVFGGKALANVDAQRNTSADRQKEIYFQRYERAWSDFFGGLVVQTPADLRTAIDELRALSESDGPYTRLFRAFSDNVTLDLGPTTLVGKAFEKGKDLLSSTTDKLEGKDAEPEERPISPVEKHFKPLLKFAFGEGAGKSDGAPSALSQYIVQLTTLEVALSQLTESKGEPTLEFEHELERTSNAVERLLGGFTPDTRLVLEPLLMNPIRGSRAGVVSTGNVYLDDKWKAEVFETWSTKLATRYPFAESTDEIALTEFAEFFRPQTGALWKFFDKNLQDRLEKVGNDFAPKASADPIPFRGDFLKCLGNAQEITDALFGSGPDLAVPFSVRLQPVGADIAEITLNIDGQAIVYRNEPERWIPTQWPGKGAKGATLEVKGTAGFNDQIPRNGDFGLFRLLTAGGLKPKNTGSSEGGPILSASWNLNRAGEAPVNIEFRPAKGVHPFGRDFFRRLKCPPSVVQGESASSLVHAP